MPSETQPKDLETWADRFEQAGWLGRVALLGGGGVRLTANLLDKALDRAAKTVVDAEHAFRGELDPNVSDAKIIEEIEEPRKRR
jgi:hypothetical protein